MTYVFQVRPITGFASGFDAQASFWWGLTQEGDQVMNQNLWVKDSPLFNFEI